MAHDAKKKKNLVDKFFAGFEKGFDSIARHYTNGVRNSIKYWGFIVFLLLAICVGAFYLFRTKPSGFVPSEDGGRVFITFQLADASFDHQSRVDVMEKMMKIVSSTPGILHYVASSGFNILNGGATSNSGTFFVMLTPWDQRNTPQTQWPGIGAVLDKKFAAAGIKNASIKVLQPAPDPRWHRHFRRVFQFQIESKARFYG